MNRARGLCVVIFMRCIGHQMAWCLVVCNARARTSPDTCMHVNSIHDDGSGLVKRASWMVLTKTELIRHGRGGRYRGQHAFISYASRSSRSRRGWVYAWFTLGLLEKSESQTKRLSYHNTFLGIAQYRRVLGISFWEGLHLRTGEVFCVSVIKTPFLRVETDGLFTPCVCMRVFGVLCNSLSFSF